MNIFLIILGKLIVFFSKKFNLGAGSTWPGHVALNINKNFIKQVLEQNHHLKIILIAGTNGKTTTGKLIQTILEKSNYRVFQNESGANLLNGIASSLLLHSNILCKINYDYVIFEVDENTLPLTLKEFTPDYLVILNLFRDQLDRYGEVNTIVNKWQRVLSKLTPKTSLILNADDPQIAYLETENNHNYSSSGSGEAGESRSLKDDSSRQARIILYFGLDDKKLSIDKHQHAADSVFCPNCNSKLYYNLIYYSHLGNWECRSCEYKRPKNVFCLPPPNKLIGTYNLYNILAATLVAKRIGIPDKIVNKSLITFSPAFGRQEILNVKGKKIQIFLSKNPTSFNESLRTIADLGAKSVLFVLNDRIPDGRDVSWIWDVDFENYVEKFKNITVSGDRAYEMGLRIKYAVPFEFSIFNFPASQRGEPASTRLQRGEQFSMKNSNFKFQIEESLKSAIRLGIKNTPKSEILYILPTYSAMLEARKILTGKKIL